MSEAGNPVLTIKTRLKGVKLKMPAQVMHQPLNFIFQLKVVP